MIKGFNIFSKGISLKVKVIVVVEFKLAPSEPTNQNF